MSWEIERATSCPLIEKYSIEQSPLRYPFILSYVNLVSSVHLDFCEQYVRAAAGDLSQLAIRIDICQSCCCCCCCCRYSCRRGCLCALVSTSTFSLPPMHKGIDQAGEIPVPTSLILPPFPLRLDCACECLVRPSGPPLDPTLVIGSNPVTDQHQHRTCHSHGGHDTALTFTFTISIAQGQRSEKARCIQ